jgi:peroxiredoxin
MKKFIPMLAAAAVAALSFTACNQKKFTVEGTVEGAQDSVLYFENVSLSGPVTLDSVKLDTDGKFAFSIDANEAPEFYRLRIYDQIINLSVDSTETIKVKAQYPNMATRYEVEGSDNCQKIRELSLKQIALQQQVISIDRTLGMNPEQKGDSIMAIVNRYKEEVKLNYIFKEPQKAYAYFALFQMVGPYSIFNPSGSEDDVRVYAAVATCWDTYYPGSERGANLHNIALQNMNNQRIARANSQRTIESSKVVEAGVIDIELPDATGRIRTLSELKGKVVLLDFHVYSLKDSPQRILMLRDLYNKYHAQGFEIYQVSIDQDEHFWRQKAGELPWICVRDESAEALRSYYVQQIPEYFTISRSCELQKRSSQIGNLEEEIKRLLSFRE